MSTRYPNTRLRRLRADRFSRDLVSENRLHVNDLIYPVFVTEGKQHREQVDSMPGVERLSIDELLKDAELLHKLGILSIAIFPVVESDKKSDQAEESFNSEGLAQRTIAKLKTALP
ncbi:MAG: porphobilinogen synthase, partial [Gammaproteobacteria bacterium]